MTAFEALKETLDAQVDRHLGDSITYKVGNVAIERAPGDPTIPAFLQWLGDDGGFNGVSPLTGRWTLKVKKTYLPAGPKQSDVITGAKLANVNYRPGASTPSDDGAYWIMDLQKAPVVVAAPVVPAVPSPLSISDFKNGIYSIGGFSNTFDQLWVDSGDYAPWAGFGYPPSTVTPGLGYGFESASPGAETYLIALPALTAVLDLNDGFTVVMDAVVEQTSTAANAMFANVLLAASEDVDFNENRILTLTNHNPTPPRTVLDDQPGAYISPNTTSGFHRIAATMSNGEMAMSVDGGDAIINAGNPKILLSILYLGVNIGVAGRIGTASGYMERAALYQIQPASALPGLSA